MRITGIIYWRNLNLLISGLWAGLHMGPHQVEATAWLKKKEEAGPEVAWGGGLFWEARQPQQGGSLCAALNDPRKPSPGGP
jgi:hypothetical protein